MDFSKLNLYSMMRTSMEFTNERQTVLSQNISNIDTPGYRAKDLKPIDFKHFEYNAARKVPMKVTDPKHLLGPHVNFANFRHLEEDPFYETKPTENNVVLEEQMAKVSYNSMENEKATTMYRKWNALMRSTLGSQ